MARSQLVLQEVREKVSALSQKLFLLSFSTVHFMLIFLRSMDHDDIAAAVLQICPTLVRWCPYSALPALAAAIPAWVWESPRIELNTLIRPGHCDARVQVSLGSNCLLHIWDCFQRRIERGIWSNCMQIWRYTVKFATMCRIHQVGWMQRCRSYRLLRTSLSVWCSGLSGMPPPPPPPPLDNHVFADIPPVPPPPM